MELYDIFRDMISLEKENYQKMRHSFNQDYDEVSMNKRLLEEHPDPSCIIYGYSGSLLVAFLRFYPIENRMIIISFQMREGYEHYLRRIFEKTYIRLISLDFELVESDVYKDNLLSLSLHKKLGIHCFQDFGNKFKFLTPKQDFLKSIEKYVRPKSLEQEA